MADFSYVARGANGALTRGTLAAATADAVAEQLFDKGLSPVRITPIGEKEASVSVLDRIPTLGPAVKPEELVLFCRQLGSLLKAGVPILRSLNGMVKTTKNKAFIRVLHQVVEDIESGRTLHAAMQQHPKVFPPLFVSMVRVGESTGGLDQAFLHLGAYIDQEKQTSDQVKSALRYPSFVVVAMALAIAVISLFVVPTFEKVFTNSGTQLPLATRILMGLSAFTQAYWPVVLGVLAASVVAFRNYVRTARGSVLWGRLKMQLPLVGGIIQRATLSRFSRSLAMGLSAGVPLVESIKLTARAVDNDFVAQKLDVMCDAIERGGSLTDSATQTGLFTPLVLQMLAVGEETGTIDELLREVAEFYEREVTHDMKNLAGAIEPILIVFMGAMVLVLALGVFLPMWDLSTAVKR